MSFLNETFSWWWGKLLLREEALPTQHGLKSDIIVVPDEEARRSSERDSRIVNLAKIAQLLV
jgi:hypothetical protein